MIKIATNHAITADQFIHVLTASGINRPTEDRGRMQRMLNNANVLLTAWDDEQLIGVYAACQIAPIVHLCQN